MTGDVDAACDVHIVWFKRDLRVEDHEALAAAAKRGPVLPLYVYEPAVLSQPTADARHVDFTNECLSELDQGLRALGAPLVYRHGPVPEVFEQLRAELGDDRTIRSVCAHQETTDLVGYRRDRQVRKWAAATGVAFDEFIDRGVIRRLESRDGWSKRWKSTMSTPVSPPPRRLESTSIDPGRQFSPEELGLDTSTCELRQIGGRRAALETLHSFLEVRAEPYATAMSSPVSAFDHCSRLSVHLALGTLSGREVYQATLARIAEVRSDPDRGSWLKSLRAFEKRLHWRDHFTQKLEDQPSLEIEAMHPMLDELRPGLDSERFERFAAGLTGYPMVDACMRATDATGWLNFRMRAMVVSFASYHLWLDWRPVAELLARRWTDYEPGIHYPQHQMQSGSTGMNTLRIYSPTKQVVDHDPAGTFIRRWVPELEGVPNEHLAEPHRAPASLFATMDSYPEPIVEHRSATTEARRRITEIRRLPEAQAISERIVERHGSRKPRTARSTS